MFLTIFILTEVCKKIVVDGIAERTITFYKWMSLWRRIWNKLWIMRIISLVYGFIMLLGGVLIATVPDRGNWCSIFLFISAILFIVAPLYFKRKIDKAV